MKSIKRILSVTLLVLVGVGGFLLHEASRPKALSATSAAECTKDNEGSLCELRTWCVGVLTTTYCFSTRITYYAKLELDDGG